VVDVIAPYELKDAVAVSQRLALAKDSLAEEAEVEVITVTSQFGHGGAEVGGCGVQHQVVDERMQLLVCTSLDELRRKP
jgi:hypothetical protein